MAPPGTISINGEDINAIPVGRLRRSIGYVPQEAFLFSRTMRENILFGRPGASEEDLLRAVVSRRVGPVNEERLRLLDGLERDREAPVERVVDACRRVLYRN